MTRQPQTAGKPTFQRKLVNKRPPSKGMAEKIATKAPRAVHAKPDLADVEGDAGMQARLAAMNLIDAALTKRSGFDEAVTRTEFLALTEGERSFARALALLVLRRLGQLDYIIETKTKKKAPNDGVWALLRIGLAQIGFMQVPDFAAVSTTVKLAERETHTRPFKGLINAILRSVIREGGLTTPVASRLAPDWLFQRWTAAYGETNAEGIALALTEEPATDLTFKTMADLERLKDALQGEHLGGLSLRSRLRGNLSEWAGYSEGVWWVQDAAAAVAAALLGDLHGKTALDLCAAPGGKTLQMLSQGGRVVALDRAKNRLKRVEENLLRTGYTAEVTAGDAENWDDTRMFDVVLLDAPCSATGTLRRQPDVLWATQPSDIAKLADVQHRLLDSAAKRVAPDGSLVYATCSLEREEGETQIVAFLRRHPEFTLQKPETARIEALGVPADSVASQGWLRLLPHHRPGGQDGFFMAHLVRSASS